MGIAEQMNNIPSSRWILELKKDISDLEVMIPALKEKCLKAFDDFWTEFGNPITRDEASVRLALIGPLAAQIFGQHYALQLFIQSVDPSWEILSAMYELEFLEDGSAKLKEVAP